MTKQETLAGKWEELSLEMSSIKYPKYLEIAQLQFLQKQMFFCGASSMSKLMYDAITKSENATQSAKRVLEIIEELRLFMETV
jgi:hypothetical protein